MCGPDISVRVHARLLRENLSAYALAGYAANPLRGPFRWG